MVIPLKCLLLSFSDISAAGDSSGLSGGIVVVIAIVVGIVVVASVILLMVMVGAIFRRNKFENRGQAVAG